MDPTIPDTTAAGAEAEALNAMLAVAKSRPTTKGFIESIFYNINLIIAYLFDSLLFYTIDPDQPVPTTISFITKILLIIVTYFILSFVSSLLTTTIPLYYSTYKVKPENFVSFLNKQRKMFENNANTKILEESGDEKTNAISIWYSKILDNKFDSKTYIDDYKSFVDDYQNYLILNSDNITLAKPDDPGVKEAYDYFMSMPDKFTEYIEKQSIFIIKSIQFWIVMLCAIIAVSNINYTFVDIMIPPKLPKLPSMSRKSKVSPAPSTPLM
jgi:hypothetical protein